jgi:hypothetical protein
MTTKIRSTAVIGTVFGLAGLLASSPVLTAQTSYGVSLGLNYIGPAPSGNSYSQGFAVQASVGRQLWPGFSVRLDALATRVDDARAARNVPCPSFAQTCGSAGSDRPVGVAGLVANGVVNVTPPGTVYLVAGGGAYYLYQHPSVAGTVRFGVSVGGGISLPVGDRAHAFVEARYHDLLGMPSQPMWLVPVTFGIRY